MIEIGFELPVESVQLLIEYLLKLLDALTVHATRPLVLTHLFPGQLQVLPLVYLVHQ
jgi:hypothetical protein